MKQVLLELCHFCNWSVCLGQGKEGQGTQYSIYNNGLYHLFYNVGQEHIASDLVCILLYDVVGNHRIVCFIYTAVPLLKDTL